MRTFKNQKREKCHESDLNPRRRAASILNIPTTQTTIFAKLDNYHVNAKPNS